MSRNGRLFLVGLIVAIVVATGVARFSSTQPDGLEFVAEQQGFADAAEDHAVAESPLADYGSGGGEGMIAGLLGVGLTLAIGFGVFWLVRTKRSDREEAAEG